MAGLQKVVQPIMNSVGNAAGNIGNKATGDGTFTQSEDNATATNAAPESAAIGVDAVQGLPGSTQKANLGLEQAGKIEAELGTPVGAEVKGTGLQTNKETENLIRDTRQDYNDAVKGAVQATTNAESALTSAAENAKIDPQAYLKSLGIDGKLMTGIGMALSGIGSGLTGQPNMAMDAYQKNMDRAIQAQTQIFKNMMEVSAQKQGLIKTAQDKQQIAANAYNAAVMSVATGANVAIQGVMTQIKSATAPYTAQQLMLSNDHVKSQAIDRHSKDFSSTIQSGNTGRTTLMGETMKPVVDYLTGKPKNPAAQGFNPAERTGRPVSGTPASDAQTRFNDSSSTKKAADSNDFDRQLFEREQEQAGKEKAIREGGTPSNSGSYGFLDKYSGKP